MSVPMFDCYFTLVWVGYRKWDWKKDGDTMYNMPWI